MSNVTYLKLALAAVTWPKLSVTSFKMIHGLARQEIRPKTVIDVGANVGQFAIAAAKLFSDVTVHSFEPNPDCVAALRKNVNSLGNVVVYPLALGDEEGTLTFHLNSHSHSGSILPLAAGHVRAFPGAREIGTIKVKVSTLDKVFSDIDLPAPVLLKLDVQGYEAQTLKGSVDTLRRVEYVVLEASFKPMYQGEMLFMDIIRLMEKFGFVFLRPVGLLTDPCTGEIIQTDALFRRAHID